MANPKNPQLGELIIDASDLASFLIDLPPGGRVGLRSRQSGYDDALAEIVANHRLLGNRAGITEHDFATLRSAEDRIAMIDARLPAARKLVEILEETRAKLDDQAQRLVSAVAQGVEGRAGALGDEELLGRYEKTRAYRSAIALKGARTRRRNADDEIDVSEPVPADGREAPASVAPAPVATPAAPAAGTIAPLAAPSDQPAASSSEA